MKKSYACLQKTHHILYIVYYLIWTGIVIEPFSGFIWNHSNVLFYKYIFIFHPFIESNKKNVPARKYYVKIIAASAVHFFGVICLYLFERSVMYDKCVYYYHMNWFKHF